jgi:hypothetical protein
MSLLSPSELLEIQSLGRSGMAGTATILTRAIIETADGQENVWAQVGEDVDCWVYEITADSATLGAISGAVALVEVFKIRLPVGSPAFSGDRLAVGSNLYDIQHTNDTDTYAIWLDCACRAFA